MSEKKFYVDINLQSNEVVKLKADTLDITTNSASANTKRIVYWAGDYYYSDGTNWVSMSGGGGGTVTNVTATTPLSSTGGATPDISISQSDSTTDGYLSSTDWNTFNNKQNALGFTPEDVANKSTSIVTDSSSNIKYPSVKAVFDWANSVFTTTSAVASQITTALTGYATQAWVTSQGYITNVITALGYTPENVANKSSSYTASSITTYANTKALVDGLATKKSIATGNAYKFETTDASGNLQETTVTANRAVVTDTNGLPSASVTTATELSYLNGVTSNVQAQINALANPPGVNLFNYYNFI